LYPWVLVHQGRHRALACCAARRRHGSADHERLPHRRRGVLQSVRPPLSTALEPVRRCPQGGGKSGPSTFTPCGTTFGTLLSAAWVALRTAQVAMRHGDIGLTMNTYAAPKLLDVAGAVEALPALPLSGEPGRERLAATGTNRLDGTPPNRRYKLTPLLALRGGPADRHGAGLTVATRLHRCLHQLLTNPQRRGQILSKLQASTPPPRNAKTLDFRPFLQVGVERFERSTSCTPKHGPQTTQPPR
jgi:hypothetical protein